MNIETVTAWIQFAAELLIFTGVTYNSVQSCLTHRKLNKVETKVTVVEGITADTNTRVAAVEVSSNGMRDELVALTAKEAFARGSAAGAAGVAAVVDASVKAASNVDNEKPQRDKKS